MSNASCPDFDALQSCPIDPSYLRPENGATIIPWLYSAALLTLHLPLAFLRVVKWKQSQWFSLVIAVFTICLTCLSYVSTKLDAKNVYVWFPIALTADISGAMQLIILIEKDKEYRHYQGRKIESAARWIRHGLGHVFGVSNKRRSGYHNHDVELEERLINPDQRSSRQNRESESQFYQGRDSRNVSYPSLPAIPTHRDQFWMQGFERPDPSQLGNERMSHHQFERDRNTTSQRTSAGNRETTPKPEPTSGDPKHIMPFSLLITFILSIIFLIILLSLQIIGLVFAGLRYFNHETLVASWCSPAFDIGGNALLPGPSPGGGCLSYPITPTHGGTGCIGLPGDQSSWLLWTFVTLCVEIIFQVLDGLLMLLTQRWDRPWLTMITGVLVYISLVFVGVRRTLSIPISGHTIAISYPQGICRTDLYEGGLRGAIVAWSDGVFQGLSTVYFGPSGN